MANYKSIYNSIEQALKNDLEWKCKLLFDVSEPDDDPNPIDLIPLMYPKPELLSFLKKKNKQFPSGTLLRFPSQYDGWKGKKQLVDDISNSALNTGGFILCTRDGFEPGSNRSNNKRSASVTLACQRYNLYDNQKTPRHFTDGKISATGVLKQTIHQRSKKKGSRPDKHRSTTKRPVIKNDKCTFVITLFLYTKDDSWYLAIAPKNSCPGIHCGHAPLMKTLTNAGISHLPESELNLNRQMLKAGADPVTIASTISQRTGNNYTSQQIRQLNANELELVNGLSPDATSADKLVVLFEQRCVVCPQHVGTAVDCHSYYMIRSYN